MSASLKPILLITPQGIQEAVEIDVDGTAVERVLTRMTKGFLALLYPEVNRPELTFKVTPLDQFKVNHPVFGQIQSVCSSFGRGAGVYRCWHCVESYSHTGLWVHMFFGSAWFQVEHTSGRKIVLPW